MLALTAAAWALTAGRTCRCADWFAKHSTQLTNRLPTFRLGEKRQQGRSDFLRRFLGLVVTGMDWSMFE
jgi:hypothetical protein